MIKLVLRLALISGILLVAAGSPIALAGEGPATYTSTLPGEQPAPDFDSDPEAHMAQQLYLARELVREIIRLARSGEDPGTGLHLRLEQHLRLAMQNATQLENGEMLGALNRIQTMTQYQLQQLNRARLQAGEQVAAPIVQAIQVMEQIQAQVQTGQQNPEAFRLRVRAGQYDELSSDESVAVEKDALSIGDENKYGPRPSQPGPGQPGGNPDCSLDDCVPVGDANQYGPNPEQPGPGEPGGNPSSTGCIPEGDKHMNGEPPASPGDNGTGGMNQPGNRP